RLTSTAFVASLVVAIAVGYPVRQLVGELQGIVTLEVISLAAAVGISLLSRQSFDFAKLRRSDALAESPPGEPPAERDGAAVATNAADPDPVR
ncbi:MAG: sodium:solute symporter, partial [Mycobacterium sp.]